MTPLSASKLKNSNSQTDFEKIEFLTNFFELAQQAFLTKRHVIVKFGLFFELLYTTGVGTQNSW